MPSPENKARENIDRLITQAGWAVCNQSEANIFAYRGVAIRNFTLKPGHGFADYLLYVDGRATRVIEPKKERVTLTRAETQSERYTKGLPDGLPAWSEPLPFSYESTGIETRLSHGLELEPATFSSYACSRLTKKGQRSRDIKSLTPETNQPERTMLLLHLGCEEILRTLKCRSVRREGMKAKNKRKTVEIVLRRGKPAAVILDINEYRSMLERLEDAEDLKMLKEIRSKPLRFRKLEDFLKEQSSGA